MYKTRLVKQDTRLKDVEYLVDGKECYCIPKLIFCDFSFQNIQNAGNHLQKAQMELFFDLLVCCRLLIKVAGFELHKRVALELFPKQLHPLVNRVLPAATHLPSYHLVKVVEDVQDGDFFLFWDIIWGQGIFPVGVVIRKGFLFPH